MTIEKLTVILSNNIFNWAEKSRDIRFEIKSYDTNSINGNIYIDEKDYGNFDIHSIKNTKNTVLDNRFTLNIYNMLLSRDTILNLTVWISKDPNEVIQFNFDSNLKPQWNHHWEIKDK